MTKRFLSTSNIKSYENWCMFDKEIYVMYTQIIYYDKNFERDKMIKFNKIETFLK